MESSRLCRLMSESNCCMLDYGDSQMNEVLILRDERNHYPEIAWRTTLASNSAL